MMVTVSVPRRDRHYGAAARTRTAALLIGRADLTFWSNAFRESAAWYGGTVVRQGRSLP